VFISHSDSNHDQVEILADQLRNKRLEPWWDKECMLPGDLLSEEIIKNLVASDYFIIVLSKDSINSDFVRVETAMALALEKERGACKARDDKKKIHREKNESAHNFDRRPIVFALQIDDWPVTGLMGVLVGDRLRPDTKPQPRNKQQSTSDAEEGLGPIERTHRPLEDLCREIAEAILFHCLYKEPINNDRQSQLLYNALPDYKEMHPESDLVYACNNALHMRSGNLTAIFSPDNTILKSEEERKEIAGMSPFVETVFVKSVVKKKDQYLRPSADVDVDIYGRDTRKIHFAGHPMVALGQWLYDHYGLERAHINCPNPCDVVFLKSGHTKVSISGWQKVENPYAQQSHKMELIGLRDRQETFASELAIALEMKIKDFDTICIGQAGLPWLIGILKRGPVNTADNLSKLKPTKKRLKALAEKAEVFGIAVVYIHRAGVVEVRSFPDHEHDDPGCGSVAASLCAISMMSHSEKSAISDLTIATNRGSRHLLAVQGWYQPDDAPKPCFFDVEGEWFEKEGEFAPRITISGRTRSLPNMDG